ncbi:alpha-L-rhamnosidase-related protein [Lactiplantibacillus pentosus]|uniref:alpha-L-rhamnosidase-related protein n=1 Tax=Lactiplantibacillus pentosus TaxID=1589 RepID=UPI002182141F|nr:alpha-rhamnosidase [Lactiplantibacillus pentosus]MCT0161411.1 alpha-rhamnosidase [Lactiplantibacillus pentosus]
MEFQTNTTVEFNRHTDLLEKANSNRPHLIYQTVKPARLVDIVADSSSALGYTAKEAKQSLAKLSTYQFGKGDSITFDLGNHEVGHFSIHINACGSPMDAPLYLHFIFGELPVEIGVNGEPYNGVLSQSWLAEEFIHIDKLPTTLELPRRYACRYIKIEVIDSSPKWKAQFSHPQFIAESAVDLNTVTPLKTGDQLLDRIDEVSLKTLHDCMQDVFEDGPKRDRRLWIGDLRLQALANYETFDNTELVKRCLYLFGGLNTKDGWITTNVFTQNEPVPDDTFFFDYSLFFIDALADYVEHTNDYTTLTDLYPIAKLQMDEALKLVDSNNLVSLDPSRPVFVDWSMDFDRSACAQAILIYTLRHFISLTSSANKQTTSYNNTLNKLIESTRSHLFDKQKNLFVSGPNKEVNLASQIWMVLAQVLDENENVELMKNVQNTMFPVTGIATPYFYHHIAEALFMTNFKTAGINLIKRYWGKMVQEDADTFWEAFKPEDPSFSPYGSLAINSYCHAWSCTPAYLLRKYVI